jgi:hypothetical protein
MGAVLRIAVMAGSAIFIAGCGSTTSTPGASSASAPVSTSSPSYQMGLKSGTSGMAEIDAFKGTSGNKACKKSFDLDQGASGDLNQQDYMAGCLYGLSHQSAQRSPAQK